MKKFTLFLLSVLIFGCAPSEETTQTDGPATEAEKTAVNSYSESADGIHFGAKIDDAGAVSYESVLPKLAAMSGENEPEQMKIIGKISDVCKVKGCWMTMVDESGTEMTVKFKDYGFFMPFDIIGKSVALDGEVFKEVTPVDELQHYAEDAGKTKEEIAKITAPKEELKFMASGVKILN